MICLGETSRLVVKDLETSTVCFEKIIKSVPKVEARLAFIELLTTTEENKSIVNSRRLAILQKWAGHGDIFSMIVLSKIVYDSYLSDKPSEDIALPTLVLNLLDKPCKLRHPVAVRFYLEMKDNMNGIDAPYGSGRKLSNSIIDIDILYDY